MMRAPVTALVVAAAVLLSASAQAAGTTRLPTIRVTGVAPLTVTGLRFGASERVKLIVRTDGVRRTRVVTASRSGGFRAVFPDLIARARCTVEATALPSRRPASKIVHRLCDAEGFGDPAKT
jgi:hypothetical protein